MIIRPIDGGIEAKEVSPQYALNRAAFYANLEGRNYGIYTAPDSDKPLRIVDPTLLEKIYRAHGIEN